MAESKIIRFDNQEYVIGLDWRLLNSESASEIYNQDVKKYSHVVTIGQPAVAAGYLSRVGSDFKVNSKIMSAGAHLTYLFNQDSTSSINKVPYVVIESVESVDGDKGYWCIAINDGIIYSDTDFFSTDIEEIKSRFDMLVSTGSVEFIGSGVKDVYSVDKESITEWFIKIDTPSVELSGFQLKPFKKSNASKIIVYLIIICIVAYFAWDTFFNNDSNQSTQDEEALRAAAIQALENMTVTDLSAPSSTYLYSISKSVLEETPVYSDYWKLGGASCDVNGCYVTWVSSDGNASIEALSNKINKKYSTITASLDGKSAGLLLPFHSSKLWPQPLPYSTTKTITKGNKNKMLDICQRIRPITGNCTVTEPSQISIPNQHLLPANTLYKKGAWKISNAPLSTLEEGTKILNYQWLKASSLQIFITASNWTMEGHYVTD